MTPAARFSCTVELLDAMAAATRRPADAIANSFFRERRYMGSADRRLVASHVWEIMRHWRRLHWHVEKFSHATSRLLSASYALLNQQSLAQVESYFSGERFTQGRLAPDERRVLVALVDAELMPAHMPHAVRFEYPDWMAPLLVERFGAATDEALLVMETTAPLDLRVNTLKATRARAKEALESEGIFPKETPLSPWGLRLTSRVRIMQTRAYTEGLIEIQDEGSQLLALSLNAQPKERIIDFCAGAGGKTLAIAAMMANKGHLIASDVASYRIESAAKRLRRAGVSNTERRLLNTNDRWIKRQKDSYDRVLVDAPCSGTGTWRRSPDARVRLSQTDLDELCSKQAEILDRAFTLLKPGGRLVYATCSILLKENEQQISAFLLRTPRAHLTPFACETLPEELRQQAQFCLSPHGYGTDGFFAACLTKK